MTVIGKFFHTKKNRHFVMCIRVSVQRNHLFCKTNTQKTVAKVNNLCTEEKPSLVYLRIRVSGGAKKSKSQPKTQRKKVPPAHAQPVQNSLDGTIILCLHGNRNHSRFFQIFFHIPQRAQPWPRNVDFGRHYHTLPTIVF